MDLTDDDTRALRQQGDLIALIKQDIADSTRRRAHRRALVLRHPDLAHRLTEPPIGHTAPEKWNGGVPPEVWREAPNTSPVRAALVAIVTEAERRAAAGQQAAPDAATAPANA